VGEAVTKQYKINETPADEAEKLWRDLVYHHKVATECGEPSAWAKVGTLVPLVQVAYQRAQVWSITHATQAIQTLAARREPPEDDVGF